MTHRDINNCLSVFVVVLAIYILLAPFLPQLDYIFNGPQSVAAPAYAVQNGAQTTSSNTTSGTPSQATSENQLYIPSIGALAPIIEGTDKNTVDKGLWHRPATATPDAVGNMVVVGHRFSYNHGVVQPFYHLDKLKVGEKIYLQWNGKTFVYTVKSAKVVKATEVSVEAPTVNAQLTLYTCTPIWNPVERLVITALPEGQK